MIYFIRISFVCLWFFTVLLGATIAQEPENDIPPQLEPWKGWVMHGLEEQLCPTLYHDGTITRCQWPSRLKLNAMEDGGTFKQNWQIFAEGWVALPGSPDLWPDAVVVNGRPAAVIARDKIPSVRLAPGEHRIIGRFFWRQIPETIHVPPQTGLLDLSVDGREIPMPVIDPDGRLWLQKQQAPAGTEDYHQVRVLRLINDTIPMRITTELQLDVAGRPREIQLEPILLQNAIPMNLTSILPVRLNDQGRILVQTRPGQWRIQLQTRQSGPVRKLSSGAAPYGPEIWSFQAQHHLRMVEITGAVAIEPNQTRMPDAWKRFPAFLLKPQDVLKFKEMRRGDPDPAPDQLYLQRTWWLDFDGRGMTIHDHISGTLSRQWFLALNPPVVLGRAAVDGEDQMITEQGQGKKAGVALRRGQLDLQADLRLVQRSGTLPVAMWDHDFQQVSGQLHLPPGWRLLAAAGVDRVSDSWLQRWSLLDFFMVLIIALTVFKLRSPLWGAIALAAMVLIYHEPNAPRTIWLHILAVMALVKILPDNWFKRLVKTYGIGAAVVLTVLILPFMVNQIRWGIYPQLALHTSYVKPWLPAKAVRSVPEKQMMVPSEQSVKPDAKSKPARGVKAMEQKIYYADSESLRQPMQSKWNTDPQAIIPTGPGLPDWQWQTFALRWNGPVAKDQTMRFWLISPTFNLILALARVTLLALLIWGLADWRSWWIRLRCQINGKTLAAALILILSAAGPLRAQALSNDFPPPQMLEQLRQRLLEKPDCLPHCADIARMEVAVSGNELQLMLKIHTAQQTAVPLPVQAKSWTPAQVMLDNAPISGLARDDDGQLWALVPAGQHTVVLLGVTGNRDLLHIPLPIKPHSVAVTAQGWTAKGVRPDGSVGSSIELTRLQNGLQTDQTRAADEPTTTLPAFLHVQRVLELGLTWQVKTTVQRMTKVGTPIVTGVPLLAGESVVTEGVHVDNKQVLIQMTSNQTTFRYTSSLKIDSKITLTAPKAVPWTETWVLDASPIWHCDLEGIAVVHHQDSGRWQPQWQPWPGEQVTIHVYRPQAIEGQSKTIDKVRLALTPGQRFANAELTLSLRTSRGGRHTIELPPQANLQSVAVNSRSLPIRQDGQWVTVPLQPGAQTITAVWHQLTPMSTYFKAPYIKTGKQAVNAHVTFKMPSNRWILLTGGPDWGPAVLFWSYLVVIVLAAVGLGRIRLMPLKIWQWILLGLGLTQVPAPMALIIIGWFLILAWRNWYSLPQKSLTFNAMQLGLALWTLAALVCLFAAVKAGLLGQPEMQIAGNHSSHMVLNWTQDRIGQYMPQPWVLSLPVWVYRGLMLAWSLWLAFSLIQWLRWGWTCFSRDSVWRKVQWRRTKSDQPGSVNGD